MILQSLDFLQDKYDLCFVNFSSRRSLRSKQNEISNFDLKYPSLLEIIYNLFFFRKRSLQERLFYCRRSKRKLDKIIEEFSPDFIVADMIRTAQYIQSNIDIKRIVELDDLLSLRYRRFLNSTENFDNILGTFDFLIPDKLIFFVNKFFKNNILSIESRLIEEREVYFSKNFDLATLVSKKEANDLSKNIGRTIVDIPLGLKKINNIYSPPNSCEIIFVGNLFTNQNLSSFQYIVNFVLPILDMDNFSYTFRVVGKYDKRATEIAKNNNNIKLLGYVDKLESILSGSTALLSPISFGTGIKIKILDCLGFGIPIITNSIGAEGIPLSNNYNAIVLEDANEMARAVIKLHSDRSFSLFISSNAVNTAHEFFDYQALKDRYISNIEKVVSC